MVRERREADTHRDRGAVGEARSRHALVERFDVASRLRLTAREDDRELVTTEAERSDAVRRASEEPGDLDEHLVAERMPVGVVDPLEVVDVDEAEAELVPPSAAASSAVASPSS